MVAFVIVGGVTASMVEILRISVEVMINNISPWTRSVCMILVCGADLSKLWSKEGVHAIPVTYDTVELQLLLLWCSFP